MTMPHLTCRVATLVALIALGTQASAQQTRAGTDSTRQASRARAKPWRTSATLDLSSEYADNVFLLRAGRTDNLEGPSTADLVSGRYTDMVSPSDLITSLQGDLTFEGPGLGGRTIAISPELQYEYYAQNAKRRNAVLGLGLEQSLPHGRAVRFKARHAPSYFAKNYLADAIDANGNGSIEPAERQYRAAVYDETELSVDYRHRLARSSRRTPLGAALRVGGGWYARSYDAPFSGRDLSGPTARLQLQFDQRRGPEFDIGYEIAALSANATPEVLLLDEPVIGQDLNGDGNVSASDVRSVQTVDRSLTEHRLGSAIVFGADGGTSFRVEYEFRYRTYGSAQPLDVAYNGRSAGRHALAGEVGFRLARNARLALGGAVASQHLSRDGDFGSTGEIQDYTKRGLTLRLGYRF